MTESNKTWQKCILLVWINVGLGNKNLLFRFGGNKEEKVKSFSTN